MITFHFLAMLRPQFGGRTRPSGRVSVKAESQQQALATIRAAASPTEKSYTTWLPLHGCPSIYGGW